MKKILFVLAVMLALNAHAQCVIPHGKKNFTQVKHFESIYSSIKRRKELVLQKSLYSNSNVQIVNTNDKQLINVTSQLTNGEAMIFSVIGRNCKVEGDVTVYTIYCNDGHSSFTCYLTIDSYNTWLNFTIAGSDGGLAVLTN